MSRTLFISDLHLDPARPAVLQALADFLAKQADCEALYILGDLFEAWPGDDNDTPLAGHVADLLKAFSNGGARLHLMPGNRDFLLGDAFCQRVGATLQADPGLVEIYGEPTLLMHGDSLCTADTEYQAFRRMSRDPTWQARLLSQSLGQRRALAAQLRSMSREATSNKAEDIMDVTAADVDSALRKYRASRLVHGHTHRPGRHAHRGGPRWVLGDWDNKGWYLELTTKRVELISFNINQ